MLLYNERRLHQALGYRAPMAIWRDGAARQPCGYVDNAHPRCNLAAAKIGPGLAGPLQSRTAAINASEL